MGNVGVPASKFNGPYNAVDRANEAMMNQVSIIAERTLPTDGSVGVGARTDLLYGKDFPLAMSLGRETNPGPRDWNSGEYYGLAIPIVVPGHRRHAGGPESPKQPQPCSPARKFLLVDPRPQLDAYRQLSHASGVSLGLLRRSLWRFSRALQ